MKTIGTIVLTIFLIALTFSVAAILMEECPAYIVCGWCFIMGMLSGQLVRKIAYREK